MFQQFSIDNSNPEEGEGDASGQHGPSGERRQDPERVELSHAHAPDTSRGATDRTVVANDGVSLHLKDWGNADNPALLLLHGIALTAEAFDEVAPELVDEFHTVAPDMRAHGSSQWHPQNLYEREDCVEDLNAIRDGLGWTEPMAIVGHSINGLHAMRYAAQYPDRVSALVLVDVVPTIDGSVMEHLFDFVLTEYSSLEEAVEAAQRLSPGRAEEEIAESLRVLMTWDEDREVFRYRCDPAFIRRFVGVDISEFWDDLSRVQCPVLLLLGGESRLITPEALINFAETLPEAEIRSVPDARHSVMVDNPEDFSVEVQRFLLQVKENS